VINLNLALIAIIVFVILSLFSILRKAERFGNWKKRNRGSRAVEQEEREKWSEQLFKEYCELIGKELPYPELERTKHWRDFAGEYGGAIRHLRRSKLDSLGGNFRQVKAEKLDSLGGEIRQYKKPNPWYTESALAP